MQASHMENSTNIDVKNLCSRKLFELLSIRADRPLSLQQQYYVEQELLSRRHYIRELDQLRGLNS